MKRVVIYTDGGCSGNPGPGGWGAVLNCNGKEKELIGYDVETTNNKMELTAAVKALQALKEPCEVLLCSDSDYMVSGFNKKWIEGWKKNGWRNSQRKTVENQDLWKELDRLNTVHKITWKWIPREQNSRCDALAKSQVDVAKAEAARLDNM